MSEISEWVTLAKENGASDIHLEAGYPAVMRVRGELIPAGSPVHGEVILNAAQEILGSKRWSDFKKRHSADLSETIAGTRCRINVFHTARGVSLAIRLLSSFQNNVRDCNLHPELLQFLKNENGLVIVSGATGSGKSTTLAAFIEEINQARRAHIITIESPIEYFFKNRRSFIRQREVQSHTPSFEQAIVDSMREDPDVLVIGEMRTPDVMRLTLNAAETGHLVMATMHSSTTAEALARICNSFEPEMQASIRAQLADCLIAVVCQRLVYLPEQRLQVPQCEILVANSGVKATIRSGQFSKLISSIQTGAEDGMWSFERYQRWIDEKRDWVRSAQAKPLSADAEPPPAIAPDEVEAYAYDVPPVPDEGLSDTMDETLYPSEPAIEPVTKKATKKTGKAEKIEKTVKKPTVKKGGAGDERRIEIFDPGEDLEEIAKKLADEED